MKLLFPSKSNKISDLIKLNQNNRSLKDYVSTIKQECAKRRSNFSTSELHTAAVSIFINGLDNELFRKSLKQQNPKDLNAAYDMIKNIKTESESNFFNVENDITENKNDKIVQLTAKVDYLQKMIVDLQRTILRSLPQTTIDRNARQNFSPKQPYIKRINTWQPNSRLRTDGFQKRNNNLTQNTFDHRGNRSNVRCYNCDKIGHLQRDCWRRNSKFRRLYEENDEQEAEEEKEMSEMTEIGSAMSADVQGYFPKRVDENCAMMAKEDLELKIPSKKFNIKQTAADQSVPKVKQYPTDVVLLDKYINGNQLTRSEMKKRQEVTIYDCYYLQ